MTNYPYQYQPTPNGIRYTSSDCRDPIRSIPCVLYPDNRRELLFGDSDMQKIAKHPFRPVALAKLAPRYELELHCVAGMVGSGRFAVVREGKTVWLDEFEHVEAEYYNGEMRYTAWDDRITKEPVKAVFIAGRGACGMVIRLDTSALDEKTSVYYLHGGVLGWHTHSPLPLAYDRNMCWGNVVTLHDGYAKICLDEQDAPSNPYGLRQMTVDEGRISANRIWRVLDGWKQQVLVRAEGATLYTATPDALKLFVPGHLRSTSRAWGEVVCAKLPVGGISYAAVGLGDSIRTGDLATLFGAIRADNDSIAKRLVVRTGITEFDGAVTAAAFPTDAVFGDNVFLHGNLSWREGYQGWRVAYGPLAYGMTEAAAKHFESHFTMTRITEGPDKGAFCGTIEEAYPNATAFYHMHQTFLHQARRHWEYTGDTAFAKRLLPILEECIEREMRRLKPGEEMLFENCLNTWISDHHWSIMGQCTQASAYLYNMHLLASELTQDLTVQKHYAERAETIKKDMNRILWQPRKGVFAYARDLKGYQMLHTEPELADIYHPTELGVADALQTYQMLDWAEANLKWERTDNGATMCRSSNWHPNGGDTYSHSVDELNGGEELNLALAYQQIGLAEPAYRIFKFAYHALYGGRDPEIYDFNYGLGRLQGAPYLYTNTALDLPCHLTVNGTSRLNPLFGDTIGMFGREVYEGILGVRPMLQKREVWLSPCIPAEMPHVDMQSAVVDYGYERTETSLRLRYNMKRLGCTLYAKLYLPVADVESVTCNGIDTAYTVEPGFCGITVITSVANATDGCIEVVWTKREPISTEERRVLRAGEPLDLVYPGETVLEWMDPQGLLENAQITEADHFTARVEAAEGSGVFFLKMRAGRAEYMRPVKLRIEGEKKPAVFRSFRDEFTAPYAWKTVNMDGLFNHATPIEIVNGVISTAKRPPQEYCQVNFDYYAWHVNGGFTTNSPLYEMDNSRWRSLVDENGIAMTGEGIPFRSSREGKCMAAATLVSPAYADRIVVPVADRGRAAYLLITGITLPMQSHVENMRVIIRYEDGTEEAYPLFNPDGIGDMWFTKFARYHDTPANGFENIGGGRGALSSAGQDLTKQIPTDMEAHILRFRLREDQTVKEIEMRVIANDVIFALMGVTLLS